MSCLRRHHVTTPLLAILIALSTARPQAPADSGRRAARCDSLCIAPARTLSFETTEGTMMNVDVSPDGRTILFDLLGDLYTVPRAGGAATRLTSGMALDLMPVFSPDGKRILFVSDRSGNENLWVVNADGTNPTPLTKDRGDGGLKSPEWSPDGEYVMVLKRNQPWLYHKSGGPGMELSKNAAGYGHRWSSDGRYVFFVATGTPGQIKRLDRRTGDVASITATPSGAARPALSADGKWLAYISTIDAKGGLRLRNLETDDDQWIAFPLDFEKDDNRTRIAFTPDGRAIVFVRGGTFHEIAVQTKQIRKIGFTAKVEQQLGKRVFHEFPFLDDSFAVRNIRWGSVNKDRSQLVFASLNQIWAMDLPAGQPRPLVSQSGEQYQPVFSPDGGSVAFVTWDEVQGGHIWRVPVRGGTPQRLTTNTAYYAQPAWSPDGSKIVFMREDAAVTRVRDSRNTGMIQWIPSSGGAPETVVSASSDNVFSFTSDGTRITFVKGDTLMSVRLDGTDRRPIAKVTAADEIVSSPDGKWIAYTLREEVYVAALPPSAEVPTIAELTGPGPVRRVTREGGQDLKWLADGRTLTWVFANRFSSLDVDKAFAAPAPAPTAAATELADVVPVHLTAVRPRSRATIALKGARVVTMKGDEILPEGTIVVIDNRIQAVGPSSSVKIPAGARVIDVKGKTIIPGLIDAHAHIRGMPRDVLVQIAPEPLVNLAYGVTTARDVNASTDQFHYRELIANGRMLGPRIYMTGPSQTSSALKIDRYEDALAGVRRYASRGSISIKQYLQPQRRQIQWMLLAADSVGINATAEGGGMMHEVAMVLDGYPAFEHAPSDVVNIYNDVVQLIAQSKVMYTPTLIVASPAAYQGEQYWYQTTNVHDIEKLNRFLTHAAIDQLSRKGQRFAIDEYYFTHGGAAAAPIVKAGGNVGVGGHGQMHGLAVHWEMWMLQMVGMAPHDILRSASAVVADGLGMKSFLGSIEVGKLADLVVLDKNPLDDIRNSTAIRYVMKNGELFDGNTLDMIWPKQQPLRQFKLRDFGPPPKSDWMK